MSSSTSSSSSSTPIPSWKIDLITQILSANALTFGSFTLKSGRISPYFVNCGLFSRGKLIKSIASAYARTIHAATSPALDFDVLFGPAYKGIPLSATTSLELVELDEVRWGNVGYAFNRKEVKDHGEGGLMVGESLKGKKVVIIDDVITAGTAIREAIEIISAQGGELVGIVVAVDRQERLVSQSEKEGKEEEKAGSEGERGSAIGEVRRETGVPVLAVLTLDDIVQGMRALGREEEVEQMEEYRRKYGASW